MEIVININNSTYEAIKHEYCAVPPQKGLLKVLWDAIKDGTPLPKGRERLIILSEEVLEREKSAFDFSSQKWISEVGL